MEEYINDTVIIEDIQDGEVLQIEECWEFNESDFENFFNDMNI